MWLRGRGRARERDGGKPGSSSRGWRLLWMLSLLSFLLRWMSPSLSSWNPATDKWMDTCSTGCLVRARVILWTACPFEIGFCPCSSFASKRMGLPWTRRQTDVVIFCSFLFMVGGEIFIFKLRFFSLHSFVECIQLLVMSLLVFWFTVYLKKIHTHTDKHTPHLYSVLEVGKKDAWFSVDVKCEANGLTFISGYHFSIVSVLNVSSVKNQTFSMLCCAATGLYVIQYSWDSIIFEKLYQTCSMCQKMQHFSYFNVSRLLYISIVHIFAYLFFFFAFHVFVHTSWMVTFWK